MKEMSFTDFCKVFEAYAAYKEAQVASGAVNAPTPGAPSVAPNTIDPMGYVHLQGVQTPAPATPMAPQADVGYAELSQRVAALEQVKQPSIPDTQTQTIDDIIVKLLQ